MAHPNDSLAHYRLAVIRLSRPRRQMESISSMLASTAGSKPNSPQLPTDFGAWSPCLAGAFSQNAASTSTRSSFGSFVQAAEPVLTGVGARVAEMAEIVSDN